MSDERCRQGKDNVLNAGPLELAHPLTTFLHPSLGVPVLFPSLNSTRLAGLTASLPLMQTSSSTQPVSGNFCHL